MDDARALAIGTIGYGEVGKIFCRDLLDRGVGWIGTWDRLLPDAAAGPPMRAHAEAARVAASSSMAELLGRADVVISAVTASETLAVALEAAPLLRAGTWFVDVNSASPGTKIAAATAVDGAGGRYVEAAVMTSVPPYGIRVPMLLGGPHAAAAKALIERLGFSPTVASDDLGVASATKMCRSVIIKGLEAIVVEGFTTARHYGVEDRMLATLAETFPGIDWESQGSYFFRRVAEHGKRRAEEMREAALTVREAGLEPTMAAAIAERQDSVSRRREGAGLAALAKDGDWRAFADRLLAYRDTAAPGF